MTTREILNEIFALKHFLTPVLSRAIPSCRGRPEGPITPSSSNDLIPEGPHTTSSSSNDPIPEGPHTTSSSLNDPISDGAHITPTTGYQNVVRYKYAPFGHLLAENIRKEWVRSSVLRREEPAFVFSQQEDKGSGADSESNLREMFLSTKDLSNGKVPFIVANITREYANNKTDGKPVETDSPTEDQDWRRFFSPSEFTRLRASLFVLPSGGQQMFYHWQSQRKYWWRKFSCDPGKISVSEDAPNKTIAIQIELPGGCQQVIETIVNHGTGYFEQLSPQQREYFEIKEGRKRTVPYLIESSVSVEVAALTLLCEGLGTRTQRQVLKLHRKLAPYKVAFANYSDDELKSLALYLHQNLRQSHIHSLFSPMDPGAKGAPSIENQLAVNDQLGIPYSILVRDSALQDGLISIRNRDTTLEEKIHISKVNDYVESMLGNS